jgi:hypothetical protein
VSIFDDDLSYLLGDAPGTVVVVLDGRSFAGVLVTSSVPIPTRDGDVRPPGTTITVATAQLSGVQVQESVVRAAGVRYRVTDRSDEDGGVTMLFVVPLRSDAA